MSVVWVQAHVPNDLEKVRRGLELIRPTYGIRSVDLCATDDEESPATYLFKTREESLGVMQILSIDDAARTVKIHYRLHSKPPTTWPSAKSARSSVQKYIDWMPSSSETLVVLQQPFQILKYPYPVHCAFVVASREHIESMAPLQEKRGPNSFLRPSVGGRLGWR